MPRGINLDWLILMCTWIHTEELKAFNTLRLRKKCPSVLLTKFLNVFLWMKIITFWFKFHWMFPMIHWQEANIGSDNELQPKRRQAIWANADLIYFLHVCVTRLQWLKYEIDRGTAIQHLSVVVIAYKSIRCIHIYSFSWGRVTHICVDKLTIIGSHNGLSPGRRQAII